MHATASPASSAPPGCPEASPFLLSNEAEYQAWRAEKLGLRESLNSTRVYALNTAAELPRVEFDAVRRQIRAFNFILFETSGRFTRKDFVALNRQLGLGELDVNSGADEDGVSSLYAVSSTDFRAQYIPYTNRTLNWHTDGYYNPPARRINAFALYCAQQADRGGDNYLFDHEYMYLLIRDRAPELLAALMAPDLMRIPANVQDNRVVRAEESGPVFSLDPRSCTLNMRYTSRPRHIVWKSDPSSERALNLVREILMDDSAQTGIRLHSGQGIVCNNILHGRQAYLDAATGPARLVYRARYYDAIDLDAGPRAAAR